jgi:hypothetical protein
MLTITKINDLVRGFDFSEYFLINRIKLHQSLHNRTKFRNRVLEIGNQRPDRLGSLRDFLHSLAIGFYYRNNLIFLAFRAHSRKAAGAALKTNQIPAQKLTSRLALR